VSEYFVCLFDNAFVYCWSYGFVTLAPNGLQLPEGGDFTTNVDAENQFLVNYKCVCGALNRQFLVGAVGGIFSI